MGMIAASLWLLASGEIYTSYPAFGDEIEEQYRNSRVEAVVDKGIVRELIIDCGSGAEGVMVHDVVGDVFCDSKDQCHEGLSTAIERTCAK